MNENPRPTPLLAIIHPLELAMWLTAAACLVFGLVSCNGGGGPERIDSYPYGTGYVLDEDFDGRYWLELRSGTTIGWQPVTAIEAARCDTGDTWRDADPYGCTDSLAAASTPAPPYPPQFILPDSETADRLRLDEILECP